MGDFLSSSKTESKSTDSRVATTGDASPVVQGSSAQAQEGAVAATGESTVAAGGSLAIDSNTGQVTIGVPPEQVGALLESILHDQAGSQQAQLGSVLSAIAPLAESKQTEGASTQQKTLMYVILAALAVVAFTKR